MSELSADEELALEYVAEACHKIAKATGMTPEEVYDEQFDGRTWHITDVDGEVTITFPDDDTNPQVSDEDDDSPEAEGPSDDSWYQSSLEQAAGPPRNKADR